MPSTQLLRSTTLAVAASLVIAAPASAGGFAEPIPTPVVTPVIVPPPVVRSTDWGGGYVGLEVSGAQLAFDDTPSTALLLGDDEFDGVLYGLHAGYRFDFGRFVAGGEIAYNTGDFDLGDSLRAIDLGDLDANVARAGVQLGFDAGRVLPYLTAGYASLDVDGAETGIDESFDGGYVGLGVDYALSSRLTLGAQYLVHSFEDTDDVFASDFDVEALGLRASYNF